MTKIIKFSLSVAMLITAYAVGAAEPCGRLTLVAGQSIMHDDDVASQTVYYTPYKCATVPISDGVASFDAPFAEEGVTLSISHSDKIYDLFAIVANDVVKIGVGPAWANNITRAANIKNIAGIWYNELTIYVETDDGTRTAAPHSATYLGTIYVSAYGQIKFQRKTPPSYYTQGNVLGIWNAYNRVPVISVVREIMEFWDYASDGLRFANNNMDFKITWIDGLGYSQTDCRYVTNIAGINNLSAAATVGCALDYTGYPLNWNGYLSQTAVNHTNLGAQVEGADVVNGAMGKHHWNALEQTTAVPIRFFGNNFSALTVRTEY